MFICGNCKEITKAGVKSQLVITETRDKRYRSRAKANRNGSDDPGGYGQEIVRAVRACPTCMRGGES